MLRRIVALIIVGVLIFTFAAVPSLALLQVGQQAPNFQLSDLSNNVHSLSGYSGKVVVFDFFTPYCSYCQEDTRTNLIPLYNSYYKNNTNVQFLSIEGSNADVATIQSVYLQATGPILWPVLINGANVFSTYDIGVTPTVYVVDPAGKIALAMPYPIDVVTLKSTIDGLLAKGWGTWGSLGGQFTASPASVSWADGRIDVFGRGSDNALWWRHYDSGTWSAWESLGGQLAATTGPAVSSQAEGQLDVFAIGSDNAIWTRYYDGSAWSSWESLSGQLAATTGAAVSSQAAGQLDVFAVGSDNALWHRSYNSGAWSTWGSLSGQFTASPAAVSWVNGRIDLFGHGSDNALWWRNYSNSAWSSWKSLSGQLASTTGPAVSSQREGQLDVFVIGSDNALWHRSYA